MTSEKAFPPGSQPPGTTSENTQPAAGEARPKRHGARPTPLPTDYEQLLAEYSAALEQVPLAADTRRTYTSRVRMYLAWLAERPAAMQDPLTDRRARDWAVRDYRHYLLREADPRRSARYVNNALAALDDFHLRRGLGKADVGREDIPKTAPKAMNAPAQIRWLRAIVTQLIRGGEDLVIVAEMTGHTRLDTLRVYSQPTKEDKQHALRHLTVDR
ncbi:hypothetical protein [Nonomuraea sp. NPDC050643]|uniref:hypothetical protein n=1 Tax=Nonomuraea sp. NPDC050643 TaxID=3155660 RepID=UPI00340865A4